MRKPEVICIRSLNITETGEMISKLKTLLLRSGSRVFTGMADDADITYVDRLCAEHPDAELILIGTNRIIDCDTIYIAGEDAFIPDEGREHLIALAADGDLQHSALKVPGFDPDVLDRDDVEGIAAYISDRYGRRGPSFRCKSKLMITGDCDFFGPGIARLLHNIDETGSIRKAANNMEMSYSKAWKMIGKAEEAAGILFLERVNGGKAGGNSVLTEQGRMFLAAYDRMTSEMHQFSDQLFDRHMRQFLK